MLNGVNNNQQDLTQVKQSAGMDKSALLGGKNPYEKIDKNLLVDKFDVSIEAFKMYEKDLDVIKFTKLAMSDPENNSHILRVAEQIASGKIELDGESLYDKLFSNKTFLKDLMI